MFVVVVFFFSPCSFHVDEDGFHFFLLEYLSLKQDCVLMCQFLSMYARRSKIIVQ